MEKDPQVGSSQVPPALDPEDYYYEGACIVFTAAYHLKRGSCCGSGCRHCPYGGGTSTEAPITDSQ